MSTSNVAAIADYLKAWQILDMEGVCRHFHPDVIYTGSLQTLEGENAIRAFFESFAKMVEKVVVRAHAVEGDHAFVAFAFHCPASVGIGRVAEMLTFEGERIIAIEHFFDPRPFLPKG